jgi:hypothetical protein
MPRRLHLALCALVSLCVLTLDGHGPRRPAPPPGNPADRGPLAPDELQRQESLERRIVEGAALDRAAGRPRAAVCFAPGTPLSGAAAAAIHEILTGGADFVLTQRWSATAVNGGGLQAGQPIALTYSFCPDGTSIPPVSGLPGGPSNLFAFLNGIYGSPAIWQPLFAQVFQRWSELSGITYLMEPQDDGAPHGSAAGVLGLRGDVRIAGVFLDGPNGVLAYNHFPDTGDMVLDTGDTYYQTTSQSSLRLRNVVAHEHGHGIGLMHVCPPNQTKLMEPFASTSYDGPQHDDVRGAQAHYGDRFESNDTALTAANLGAAPATTQTFRHLSLDDPADVDWYRFTVPAASFEATITLRPIGGTYQQEPQSTNGGCGPGFTFNSLTVANLRLEILDQNGTTVLATAGSNAAGVAETLGGIFLPSGAGAYFARVTADTSSGVQAYELEVSAVANVAAFAVTAPHGIVESAVPGTATTAILHCVNLSGAPNPAAASVLASINGGPFAAQPMAYLGGGDFLAVLPSVPCSGLLRWYAAITPVGGGAPRTLPAGGASAAFRVTTLLDDLFTDNFESQKGWAVTNDAALTDGQWERGVPIGGGLRGDPIADADGSGKCYVTANRSGNSDVDDGATTLTSPAFNLSGQPEARIRFSLWYDNITGTSPGTDTLDIQITNNGTTWVPVESYNLTTGRWETRDVRVADFVGPNATVRMRFIAQDPPPGAVVEAGIDAFSVAGCLGGPALGNYASGSVGEGAGGPVDVLLVNGSSGGARHRVDVARNQSIAIAVAQPATTPFPAAFAVFGMLGVPGSADILAPGSALGIFAFTPCPASPGNPLLFTLFDNLGIGGCPAAIGLPQAPAIFTYAPGLPAPVQATLQGVIVDLSQPATLAVTNAVILNVGP